jgi:NADH-quinone oxidoreductase subunit I
MVGLMTVFKYTFFRKNTTLDYPIERFNMSERFRGRIGLVPNPEEAEDGKKTLCIACGQCERICPSSSIEIKSHKEEGVKGKIIDSWELQLSSCIYCGLCVEVCPTDALRPLREYEISVYDKNELLWGLDQLLEPEFEPYFIGYSHLTGNIKKRKEGEKAKYRTKNWINADV